MVFELAGCRGEAQVEQFVLRLLHFRDQFFVRHGVEFVDGEVFGTYCHQKSPPSREMKRVFIGSLCWARRIASRASASSTPASSKTTRPGLTFATHHSGEPLPEPMRGSAGVLGSGRSWERLSHTVPDRVPW